MIPQSLCSSESILRQYQATRCIGQVVGGIPCVYVALRECVISSANFLATVSQRDWALWHFLSSAVQLIQSVISNHTGNPLPDVPAPLPAASFGAIHFEESGSLLAALPKLYPGDGIPAFKPAPMESYGQP